jgi:hypothetical protein
MQRHSTRTSYLTDDGQHVGRVLIGYEDRSGITWARSASSSLQPFREDDFSFVAVCRASRALAAAAAFGPVDVVTLAFRKPP